MVGTCNKNSKERAGRSATGYRDGRMQREATGKAGTQAEASNTKDRDGSLEVHEYRFKGTRRQQVRACQTHILFSASQSCRSLSCSRSISSLSCQVHIGSKVHVGSYVPTFWMFFCSPTRRPRKRLLGKEGSEGILSCAARNRRARCWFILAPKVAEEVAELS